MKQRLAKDWCCSSYATDLIEQVVVIVFASIRVLVGECIYLVGAEIDVFIRGVCVGRARLEELLVVLLIRRRRLIGLVVDVQEKLIFFHVAGGSSCVHWAAARESFKMVVALEMRKKIEKLLRG